jgi:osmotically-inducible protein OsmY
MFRSHKPSFFGTEGTARVLSLLAGAGLMYLLDPATGRRRRAMIRDKFVRVGHVAGRKAGATARDLGNRLRGAAARTRGKSKPLSDDVLAERIRARLGRLLTDPGAVEVSVERGEVELLGTLPALEAERLVSAVKRLRGVRNVQNHLEIPPSPAESRVS